MTEQAIRIKCLLYHTSIVFKRTWGNTYKNIFLFPIRSYKISTCPTRKAFFNSSAKPTKSFKKKKSFSPNFNLAAFVGNSLYKSCEILYTPELLLNKNNAGGYISQIISFLVSKLVSKTVCLT